MFVYIHTYLYFKDQSCSQLYHFKDKVPMFVLGIEPRALHVPGNYSFNKLHFQLVTGSNFPSLY